MPDFQLQITDWYRLNKRDLPWRNTTDPFKIWLSEVILQQTRVDQGLAYYLKFIQRFETVHELARATEQEVLSLWQGLGYYSRARNLHNTAKFISSVHNGIFPGSFLDLKKLKGIGDYTAAAIASFCFNESVGVVDGNVYRVLSRYFNVDLPIDSSEGKKYFFLLAQELISVMSDPGEYNQAIMEFGALQCTPKNPDCTTCPLQDNCQATLTGTQLMRPIKKGKTKTRPRFFHYYVLDNPSHYTLVQRGVSDIWANLFEFPMKELSANEFEQKELELATGTKPIKHILSHQTIYARFLLVTKLDAELSKNTIQIKKTDLSDYPLPRIIDRYLEDFHQKN
jgi:A/G-specific adenine glycosylase